MTAQFRSFVKSLFVAALLSLAATANAATIHMRAWIDGAQVPLPVGGTGVGTVTFDNVTKLLTWSITFQGLTGDCIVAHFHGPASAGVNNDPVVTIPCSASPLVGSATLNATQEAWLLSGQLYINIHTAAHGGGEIRGQVLPVRRDFSGDGRSDVVWRHFTSGENYLYPMDGTAILGGEGYVRTVADLDWKMATFGDFNGDGKMDIFWRHATTGENYIYLMDGTSIIGEGYIRTVADLNWGPDAGDFNGDGKTDIFWRNDATGENYVYLMDGLSIVGEGYLRTVADLGWYVAGIGDFNGDGKADLVWRNDGQGPERGQNYIYMMDGTTIINEGYLRTVADMSWDIAGVADFDGDGRADILWRNFATGENYLYPMAGLAIRSTEGYLRTVADQTWRVVAVGDFNGDGRADILWRNDTSGENYLYFMGGTSIVAEGYTRTVADQQWKVMGLVFYDDQPTPQLQLVFNIPSGIFDGNTGTLTYPPQFTYYYALFNSGYDTTPPPTVFFNGAPGSGLNDSASVGMFPFPSGTGASYISSSQPGIHPPGGLWTVSYEDQTINFNLPDPDSANRYTSVVPTVTLNGDTVTQIDWVYRNMSGAQIAPPAFGSSIELQIFSDPGGQGVLYQRRDLPVATTSHVPTAPISWSAVAAVFMSMYDNLGNRYSSYWLRPPPE
jgi:hypothetical protein